MKTEVTILAGINNLKTQLKKVMTEASTLEVMIREMESSLNGGKRLRVYTLHNSKKAVTAD